MKYKRILLKLSGECLAGNKGNGIDFDSVLETCREIKEISKDIEIGIVVGGGNFWRGRSNEYMDRPTADNIGMLATVMNSLVLHDAFRQIGVKSKVLTSIEINKIAEIFNKEKALEYFKEKNIVIFGGGTGNPFFSTDTGASLRAIEIEADAILKGTNVEGIYNKDPNKYQDAIKYDEISYEEVLNQKLKVMDLTAISMCMENNMKILVYNMNKKGNLKKALNDEIGTIVK